MLGRKNFGVLTLLNILYFWTRNFEICPSLVKIYSFTEGTKAKSSVRETWEESSTDSILILIYFARCTNITFDILVSHCANVFWTRFIDEDSALIKINLIFLLTSQREQLACGREENAHRFNINVLEFSSRYQTPYVNSMSNNSG